MIEIASAEEKKEYAKICGEIVRDTGLPFELILSLGKKAIHLKYFEVPVVVSKSDFYTLLSKKTVFVKEIIKRVLGEEIYYKSGIHDFGYVGANRVARWLVGQMDENKQKRRV